MIDLNLNRVNLKAPYTVWRQGNQYIFKTDYLIIYSVTFDKEEMLEKYFGYWFNLSNTSGQKSPNDKKISLTLVAIIEEFFFQKPNVLLYLCDSANNQQAQRARLFFHWFEKFNREKDYVINTAIIKDEEEENYVALIAKNDNPYFKDILSIFSNEVEMFKENK